MTLHTNYFKSIFLLAAFTLTACGGGGGGAGTPTVLQGNFIDSAVEGLTYTSGNETGVTDSTGLFSYESGKTVTFSVGDIVIGTANGTKTITPVQLVANAVDENHADVLNITQFLLTIDDDHNSSNGIQITQAIRDAAVGLTVDFTDQNFDTSSAVSTVMDTLTTASAVGSQVLVSESGARIHLNDSLLSLLAGSYSGTFSGDDNGTWNIFISAGGVISGSGSNNSGSTTIIISGAISSRGDFTGSGWTGSFDVTTGTVSGTWSVSVQNTLFSGSYTGSKN